MNCPTGYCSERVQAREAKAHAKKCAPKCNSGVHNFPVCDFRCLRKAYPTQMVHVFNPQTYSITLEEGDRFSKRLKKHPYVIGVTRMF